MEDERPITKLNVSTSKDEEEILGANGYRRINTDLNEGTGKNQVFIWYKKECGNRPVTRIQFSFNDSMKSVLADAWYELVDRDLNRGAGGDYVFLWYFCGSTEYDIPIVGLKVSKDAKEEPALLQDGWERLGCDLKRKAGGKFIYLWVKRKRLSYICEITATVNFSCDRYLFEQGYTRVDEDTNRGAGGKHVFLWYRRSTDMSKALTALNVSTSPREQAKLQASGFKMVCVDLSEGAGGNYVYTWYKKERCESQIQAMVLLINPDAWKEYQKAGINFVEKNLNEGNKGWKMCIAYK